jgi:hypothetical protein
LPFWLLAVFKIGRDVALENPCTGQKSEHGSMPGAG